MDFINNQWAILGAGFILFLFSMLRLKMIRFHTGSVTSLLISIGVELLIDAIAIGAAVWYIYGFERLISLMLIVMAGGAASFVGYIERTADIIQSNDVRDIATQAKQKLEERLNAPQTGDE